MTRSKTAKAQVIVVLAAAACGAIVLGRSAGGPERAGIHPADATRTAGAYQTVTLSRLPQKRSDARRLREPPREPRTTRLSDGPSSLEPGFDRRDPATTGPGSREQHRDEAWASGPTAPPPSVTIPFSDFAGASWRICLGQTITLTGLVLTDAFGRLQPFSLVQIEGPSPPGIVSVSATTADAAAVTTVTITALALGLASIELYPTSAGTPARVDFSASVYVPTAVGCGGPTPTSIGPTVPVGGGGGANLFATDPVTLTGFTGRVPPTTRPTGRSPEWARSRLILAHRPSTRVLRGCPSSGRGLTISRPRTVDTRSRVPRSL